MCGAQRQLATFKTCTGCKVALHTSYFHRRKNRPTAELSRCKACQREQWRMSNQRVRGGLRGYCKVQRVTGTPEETAQAIIAMARSMRLGSEGVRVYRLPSGEVRFWQGAMRPPKGAEAIGLYDFDALPEYVVEDLAA